MQDPSNPKSNNDRDQSANKAVKTKDDVTDTERSKPTIIQVTTKVTIAKKPGTAIFDFQIEKGLKAKGSEQ
ncbi:MULTISPECIES: hypothetical protein [Acidithrix]|uniref:Uncharacterized protein n=1 Tax=Acidithrix ferrooxidans TaxID=1280514 RepID=A0A0D8HJ95_9ACTN|nr:MULTISPECIES: hypothetical protein [Acidithrix]KJF17934.1 hypothetical protein AXFE_12190 [Acidithrix ferrooxidans]CAG4933804.1 unnamed protein product [Acidithrix sp. C25]